MPHYKDLNNKVHFLDSVDYEYLLPADCLKITDEEADILQAPQPPTAEQQKQQATNTIQATLDSKAKEFGFDSIHTAAVWTISKNPDRKARADALVAWGDAVWDFAEAEWEKQAEGKGTFTTVDEFLAALPKFPGVKG